MEEIKFRAVTPVGLIRVPSDSFSIVFHDTGCMVQMWCSDGIVDEFPVTGINRYTGLKDQNGKGTEMCQGDLVSASGHGIGEVQKNNWGEWVLVFKDSVETIHDLMMEQDLGEIVGTIYENPELLDDAK